MAATGGWQRSKYPLQANSKSSVPSAPPLNNEQVLTSPLDADAEKTGHVNGQAPWHRAVPNRHTKRYSITSQAGSDSNNSLHQYIDEGQAIDGSSTAFSISQRSLSPLPIGHGFVMRPDHVEDSVSSIHPSRTNRRNLSSASDKRARNFSYPLHPATEATMSDDSRSASPEVDNEYRPSSNEEKDGDLVRKRTLRRTPRSRRLHDIASAQTSEVSLSHTSPTQATGTFGLSHSIPPEDVQDRQDTSNTKPWKRQIYPVQSAKNASTAQQESPLQREPESSVTNHVLVNQSTSDRFSQGLQPYPVQATTVSPTDVSAFSSSLEDNAEDTKTRIAAQVLQEAEVIKTVQMQRRQKYPLQAPVSHATLRQSPTPPSSPERESTDAPKKSGIKTYPLQAPVSNGDLGPSLTPPSSPDRELGHSSNIMPGQLNQLGKARRRGRALKRQKYPLQDPASIADLRTSSTPTASAAEVEEKASKSTFSDQQERKPEAANRNATFRRHAYPLQSPTGIVNPQASGTLSPSVEVAKVEQKDNSKARHFQPTIVVPKPIGLTQSRTYPLQAPSTDNQASYPSRDLTLQDEAKTQNKKPPTLDIAPQNYLAVPQRDEQQPIAITSREGELAVKVLNQWRRMTYPLQSPKNVSPFHRAPTPQPPEEDSKKNHEPVHLPKNIHAVQDVNKPAPKGRTIVVCLDGTGDKFDNDNSNIVHLIAALKKDDPNQVSYYQAGIGTYSSSGLSTGAEAALDMAIGSGLGLHVRDAYHFLMHSYKEGDRICIFGFSRGAYTARCLAGMIHKVGLLPPRNIQQIPFAYEFYKNDTPEGWKQSDDFKKTFSIDVCVYFLGCFDSVASVGFIPRQLPLAYTPTSKPRYFRHAMALDERRAKFKICRHQAKRVEDITIPSSPAGEIAKEAVGNLLQHLPTVKDQDDHPPEYSPNSKYFGKHNHPNVSDEEYERLTGHEAPFDTDVLEVWFAGAHADVGGGAVPNDERHKLAQIPLRWMIRQAFDCNTGIIFKTKVLAEYGLDVHTLWPKYSTLQAPSHGPPPSLLEKYESGLPPRSVRRSKLVPIDRHEKGEHFYHLKSPMDEDWTPEQVEDFYDAISPLNDQLIQAPTWWILEAWPVEYKIPLKPGVVELRTGPNLGRYRGVDDEIPNLHWTVLHRVRHMGYKIQARTAANTTWKTVV